MKRLDPVRYARAIERDWQRNVERPVVLSPRDWRRIEEWCDRGIPLQLIRECLDGVLKSKRRSAELRDLGAIARAVDEDWAAMVDSRRESTPDAPCGPPKRPRDLPAVWREVAQRCDHPPLRGLLEELLVRLDGGAPRAAIETELELRLADCAPPAIVDEARAESTARLATHRARMQPDVFDATLRQAVLRRLRASLGLPSLGEPER